MPFLAVCPACGHAQVCVLPRETFPRLKCTRCRTTYDPVGSDDTEIIPELAGEDLARLIERRRALQTRRARARRARAGTKRRRARAPSASAIEVAAAAVLAVPDAGQKPELWGPGSVPDSAPRPCDAPSEPTLAPPPAPTGVPNDTAPVRRPVAKRRKPVPLLPEASARPLATCAFVLLGAGLLSARFEKFAVLVGPFAATSTLIALCGIRTARRDGDAIRFPATVAGAGAVVLLVAFASPRWLSPGQRKPPAWAASDVQIIPFPQYTAEVNVWKAEWTDASKAALQQGQVRIQVIEARIGTAPGDGPRALLVHIRLFWQPGFARGQSRPRAGEPPATLGSDAGDRLEQYSAELASEGNARPDTEDSNVEDRVLQLTMPQAPAGPLRVELPASAWGGRGTVKFQIPTSMIKR